MQGCRKRKARELTKELRINMFNVRHIFKIKERDVQKKLGVFLGRVRGIKDKAFRERKGGVYRI